ncbi:MAG TPA: helix-turn-helix domain-containing protein [Candidatus Hydrogenedentes bacterium]|nr:helix-turn-helix domain-containing protein [Candidatus Hydrogenedentota bacterium]
MTRIRLQIEDPAMRITLAVMLKAAGHEVIAEAPQITIADNAAAAIKAAASGPALLLAAASGIGEAVEAMKHGVYGYIFVPLQPGEAVLMVEGAAGAVRQEQETPHGETNLKEVERRHILNVLRECRGNQVKAANLLGIGRNTLWRKLKQYRITEDEDG